MECVQNVKESFIPKGNDGIFGGFWNVHNSQKVTDQKLNKNMDTIKRGEFHMMRIKIYLKEGFKDGKRKLSRK